MKKVMILLSLFLSGLWETAMAQSDNKAKDLIHKMEEVNGGWEKLSCKKDVEFTYIYRDMGKGVDVSTERLIFDGEYSWAEYFIHEVNVLPETPGKVQQGMLDGNTRIELNGQHISNKEANQMSTFMRRVNFFWFAMMYKMSDDAVIARYLGNEDHNGTLYDKVSITYQSAKTGKELNDEFILYFNPESHLVDFFYFSLPAFGIGEPLLKMEIEYSVIDGIHVATTRNGYAPNQSGNYDLIGQYISLGVEFGNNFKISNNKIENNGAR